jgi:hypothetical protein
MASGTLLVVRLSVPTLFEAINQSINLIALLVKRTAKRAASLVDAVQGGEGE